MKGAIGNAFILNIVITFMIIFFALLIGSMAYSKAYKTKNFIIDTIDQAKDLGKFKSDEMFNSINTYLSRTGYIISTESNKCYNMREKYGGYIVEYGAPVGSYDYCIYKTCTNNICANPYSSKSPIASEYYYTVLVYMKFDFPVIGDYIKIPITGQTKTYTDITQIY